MTFSVNKFTNKSGLVWGLRNMIILMLHRTIGLALWSKEVGREGIELDISLPPLESAFSSVHSTESYKKQNLKEE